MARILRATVLLLLIASIGLSNHFMSGQFFGIPLTEQRTEDDTRGTEEFRLSHSESRIFKIKESKPSRVFNTFCVVQAEFFPRIYIATSLLYLTIRVIRI
jgi:hypothetical protein